MSVFVPVHLHVLKTICPNITKVSVHVTHDRGLVLLWQHCNMLCTFSFVDDVTLAHIEPMEQNQRRCLVKFSRWWHQSAGVLCALGGGKVCYPRLPWLVFEFFTPATKWCYSYEGSQDAPCCTSKKQLLSLLVYGHLQCEEKHEKNGQNSDDRPQHRGWIDFSGEKSSRDTSQSAAMQQSRWCCYYLMITLQQWLTMLLNGPKKNKIASFSWGIWTPSNTWFLGPARVTHPNGISIGSTFLHGSWKWPTDTQTMLLHL